MSFLIEILWAALMVGVPIALFTLAIVWWTLKQGHFQESLDSKALEREIKAMSAKRKKDKKDRKKDKNAETGPDLHPVQKKWAMFGGGFYGIVGLFTYLVIEVLEIITLIRNFGGIFEFLRRLDFDVIIQLFVGALSNFIAAIVWPAYWLRRIETDQTWVWFVMAYAGYWLGLRLAQALSRRRSEPAV